MRTKGDVVTLAGTDGEISLKADVPDCSFDESVQALLPTARLLSILRELTDDVLILQINDRKLKIKSGGAEFNLSLEDPADFPPMAKFDDEDYFVITASVLQTLIKRTIFACDTESTRYALGGVQVEFGNENVTFAATDSRRLSVATGACGTKGSPSISNPGTTTVIPSDAVKLMAQISDGAATVEIAIHANDVAVRCGSTVLTSQLVQGRFPDWRRVLPTDFKFTVDMVAAPFHSCLRQAMIVTSEESRAVAFTFAKGLMKLSSQVADMGSSDIEMPISWEAEKLVATFDPRYMADFAKAIDGAPFKFNLISSEDPAVLIVDGFSYVVMPLSRDR